MMNRKFSIFLASVLVLSFLLISCSNKSPSNGFNKRLRGQINIIVDKEREEYIKTFSKEFTKVFPSVSFNIKVSKDVYDNFEEILNERGRDKSSIIITESKYSPYIIKDYYNKLWDISTTLHPYKENYYKEQLKTFSLNNAIYGLPLDKKPYYMIYRKDIFEKNNINPEDIRTWQEFIDKCNGLNKKLNKEYKFILEDKSNDIYYILLSQLAASNNYFSDNSNLSVQDINKAVNVMDSFEKVKMISSGDLIEEIKSGRLISSLVSLNSLSEIMDKIPEMKGKLGVTKVPAFEIGGNREISLEGYSLFISKDTHNKDAVITFLEFIIANEKIQQEVLFKEGILSCNSNTYKWADINRGLEYYNNIKLWLMAAYTEKLLIEK